MPEGPDISAPAEPVTEAATPETAAPATPAVLRSAEQTARAARLATALRENLRRRKAPRRTPPTNGN